MDPGEEIFRALPRKNINNTFFYSVQQDKSQMDQKFKDKDETIYLLKENISISLYNLGVRKNFLILIQFPEAMRKKIDAFH